jgi:hypothetical protein
LTEMYVYGSITKTISNVASAVNCAEECQANGSPSWSYVPWEGSKNCWCQSVNFKEGTMAWDSISSSCGFNGVS